MPFGRSLTYRFAQSSFFAVSALNNNYDQSFSVGEGKYLLLQNLRYWFQQPIFTAEGFLSIGYTYPNLVMAEGYNAPGSPYWALKSFCILALPDDDVFWSTPEIAPKLSLKTQNPHSRMLLVHSPDSSELQAFTVGQHSHEHAHGEAKYEKFVYSTTFGFSVPQGTVLPKQGAFDNTIAISEGDTHFQTPFGYQDYFVGQEYVYSLWQPYADVSIQSYIVPIYPWHIRYHVIETKRPLQIISGSFAAPNEGPQLAQSDSGSLYYQSSIGTVGIKSFSDQAVASLCVAEPNTNLLYPRTVIPQVKQSIQAGTHHLLLGCLGHAFQTDIPAIHAEVTNDTLHLSGNYQQTIALKQ